MMQVQTNQSGQDGLLSVRKTVDFRTPNGTTLRLILFRYYLEKALGNCPIYRKNLGLLQDGNRRLLLFVGRIAVFPWDSLDQDSEMCPDGGFRNPTPLAMRSSETQAAALHEAVLNTP